MFFKTHRNKRKLLRPCVVFSSLIKLVSKEGGTQHIHIHLLRNTVNEMSWVCSGATGDMFLCWSCSSLYHTHRQIDKLMNKWKEHNNKGLGLSQPEEESCCVVWWYSSLQTFFLFQLVQNDSRIRKAALIFFWANGRGNAPSRPPTITVLHPRMLSWDE